MLKKPASHPKHKRKNNQKYLKRLKDMNADPNRFGHNNNLRLKQKIMDNKIFKYDNYEKSRLRMQHIAAK